MRRRWSIASKAFLVLAVVCAASAFLIVRAYAARLEALRPVVGPPATVLVAGQDLVRGTRLTASMLREEQVPARFAPPGALSKTEQAEGATLTSDLAEGEPLTRTRIAVASTGPVASLVPPGLRAFTVQAGLPPGSIRPGDLVDVLATFGGNQPHTETVASGLQVLLVLDAQQQPTTQAATGAGSGPPLVLLVSPDEAERLAFAKAFADLSISIEGPSGGSS